jgi:uncharacterized Zn finger protein (UPF0148 family)
MHFLPGWTTVEIRSLIDASPHGAEVTPPQHRPSQLQSGGGIVATTQCPACGLTVPYFCCEGLVCPACGYDEEQYGASAHDVGEPNALQPATPKPTPANARVRRPPVQ